MLKVVVRFDATSKEKAIRLEGQTPNYPEVNKEFSVTLLLKDSKIVVDLGTVFNIEPFGDMLLVQTNHVVAEVWIISGEEEQELAEVLPFVSNYSTLFMKNKKITSLDQKGAVSSEEALIKRTSLIKFLKDKVTVFNNVPRSKFRSIGKDDTL